ncbi:hypothetical protein QFZ72_005736 [Bacillus sp. V2I10]|nr:hypothetical protein [Bacillus sp. V2I10]
MAQEDRDRIRKRQREGIDVPLQIGVVLGRPKVQATKEFNFVYGRWKARKMTQL